MSSSLPDTWWHEGALQPLPLADLRALAQERKIEPSTPTWPDGGDESFPACWHLDHWFTHPDLFDADHPRSLVEIFFQDQAGLFGELTTICYGGGEIWEDLAEFDWTVPEHLWPVEPDLADMAQTDVGGNVDHDVSISRPRKKKRSAKKSKTTPRQLGPDASLLDQINEALGRFDRAVDRWSLAFVRWSRSAFRWSSRAAFRLCRAAFRICRSAFRLCRSAVQSTWAKAKAARAHQLEKRPTVLSEDTDVLAPSTVILPPHVNVLVRSLGTEDTGEVAPKEEDVAAPAVELPKTAAKEISVGDPVAPPTENLESDPYRDLRALELALTRRIADQVESNSSLTAADTDAGKELVLLFFLSFFDRPAEAKLLPIIFPPGTRILPPLLAANGQLTAPHLSAGELRSALDSLSRQGLVTRADAAVHWEKAQIDCPPLVREYFSTRLAELDKTVHQGAHGRFYDHLRFAGLPVEFQEPVAYALLAFLPFQAALKKHIYALKSWPHRWTRELPPTLLSADWPKVRSAAALIDTPAWTEALAHFLPSDEAGMTPLFTAIGHGCQAAREAEAWSEVYWPRVARGNEVYASKKLGLYGQELTALASFFHKPFAKPSPNLPRSQQALLLNHTGFRLRSLGRLEDAVEPMRLAIDLEATRDQRRFAALNASNLSDLLVTLGRLEGPEGAVALGVDSVAYADLTGVALERIDDRTVHGDALLRIGQARQAEIRFREAERLQKVRQPGLPQLYSTAGYRYVDLLLARGRAEEAKNRAGRMMEGEDQDSLLEKALYRLALARAHCALRSPRPAFPEALAALRRANDEGYLLSGLLAHAEASWLSGNRQEAEELLAEAEIIATRSPMPLLAADAALLRARIARAAGDLPAAREKRDQAATLISRHGYGMRKPDLALLNAELGEPDSIRPAIAAVEAEGWWALLPRLEALLKDHPKCINDLDRLLDERVKYNWERDDYLAAHD